MKYCGSDVNARVRVSPARPAMWPSSLAGTNATRELLYRAHVAPASAHAVHAAPSAAQKLQHCPAPPFRTARLEKGGPVEASSTSERGRSAQLACRKWLTKL